MFTACLLLTTSLAKYQLWEMDEPLTLDLGANAPTRRVSVSSKNLLTQAEAGAALRKTDCSAFVGKHPMSLKANSTCWNYDWHSTPHGCPTTGWVKTDEFKFVKAHVAKAGIAVDNNNHIGLVVQNVSYVIAPTKFVAQEFGLFTVACPGTLTGLISGAVNAVEAAINLTAEGVPIIGEAAASPVDGLVVKLEHELDPSSLCAVIENVVEDLVSIVGDYLQVVVATELPPIVSALLEQIIQVALHGSIETSSTGELQLPKGWTRLI